MKPEDRASEEFNALPIEERKRICNFMNMERIRELQRQKRIHRRAIEDLDESIKRQREWMYRDELPNQPNGICNDPSIPVDRW